MSDPEPTRRPGRPALGAVAIAVEQRLADLGLDADPVETTRGEIAAALGVSTDAVKRGLQALRRAGRLVGEHDAGYHVSRYERPAGYAGALPPARPPLDPPDPPPDPGPTPGAPGLSPPARGRTPDLRSEPSKDSRVDRTAPLRAHEEPPDPPGGQTPPGPQAARPPVDAVEVGQAVVGWAVDEQRRLGKPALDGALLAKIGSMAKRMADAVPLPDLKLAVEYLVARDMTALDAAHRKVLAETTAHAPTGERAQLRELAEASRGARDPRSFDPHRDDELVEAWAFLAATWYREPLPDEAERAAWHAGLRPFPMDCILYALTMIARRGDRFRPTWGQVHAVAAPKFKDAVILWRATAQAERIKRIEDEA